MFAAIFIVLLVGYSFKFNKYIRMVSLVLLIGFWFSFEASGVPSFNITPINATIWYAIGKATIAIIVVSLGMFYLKKLMSK
ncbi:hypothetical protein D0671_22880 [Salmonella enterica]|nr:hypothetical protein [Salmonella enterica]